MNQTKAICHLAIQKKARIGITFAGQANDYIRELRDLWQRYSIVKTLVKKVNDALIHEIETPQAVLSGCFPQGLSIEKWLRNERSVPQDEYLFSSPVSQPLVILTQIANYLSLCMDGYCSEETDQWVVGLTGHSQGIVPALIVSMGLNVEDIIEQTIFAARYLLWQGIRMEQAHDFVPSVNKEVEKELGTQPRFMAAISGFTSRELQDIIDEYNKKRSEKEFIYLSLDNETTKKVVSAPPSSLENLRLYLKTTYPKQHPFPLRDMRFTYLNTSAPFHSPYMESCIEPTLEDIKRIGWEIDTSKCKIPVYDFSTGKDLRKSEDIMRDIVSLQGSVQLVWKNALNPLIKIHNATHILDFGPGDGITKLSRSYVAGYGIETLCVSRSEDRVIINSTEVEEIPFSKPWSQYLPTITEENGKRVFHNAFTKFCGRSPVILPGMTPTTATSEIIVATANAGYLAELAGGGQVTEKMFRERMKEISEKLDPQQGIVLNTLYLDPYLWNLQIKKEQLLFKLKQEGYPFIGITISAGLPPVGEAVALLDKLHSHGMFLNAFKAGTDAQIKHILEIAAARPQYTICMQVEGGLAGGHHGWYDVRHVLLKNYHRIRQQKNILLLAGGGIREEKDAIDFVMGTWNAAFEVPIMPIDGVFLGTLVMACRESEASEDCKKALVDTEGTSDWMTSMATGEIKGGMTSGKSSLDADIYYIENKAAHVGRFLDKVAGNKEEVAKNKAQIINLLNSTARTYFGDLDHMSYFDVLEKMIALMATGKNERYEDGRWLDVTYRSRFAKMLRRCLQRFDIEDELFFTEEFLQQPEKILERVAQTCPLTQEVLVAPEDKIFFIQRVCQMPGKPVNFVPVIDENIRKWYKSDSLHNCNSSLYQADGVFQTPGPRAVSGINEINEPIAGLFQRFHKALVAEVTTEDRDGKEDSEKYIEQETTTHPTYWQNYRGRIAALLQSQAIVRGQEITDNYVPRLLELDSNERLFLKLNGATIERLELQRCKSNQWQTVLELGDSEQGIELKIHHTVLEFSGEKTSTYSTYFAYHSQHMQPFNIEEIDDGRVERIAKFYSSLLLENIDQESSTQKTGTFDLNEQVVRSYIASLGGKESNYSVAPLSMSFVIAWQPIFSVLLHKECVGDFFTLVHLANNIALTEEDGLVVNRKYNVTAALTKVSYAKEGKKVTVVAQIEHDGKAVVSLESHFLLREKVAPHILGKETVFDAPFIYPATSEKTLSRPYYAYEKNLIAPRSGNTYAMVSKDFNPLHRDNLIAKLAGFDNPLVHGMWSKGVALQTLRQQLDVCHKNIVRIEMQFSAPAMHGDSMWTYGRHIAMHSGQKVYEVNCAVEKESARIPTVTGKIYTAKPQIAMVFPGQGIQAKGMGMEGYSRSGAVREVWNRADTFTKSEFGFSILQIVKENPNQLIVDGEIVRHEKGVLFLTQFTQVALVAHALASIAELKEAGIYNSDHYFCGHSIGEYSAISACGILALEKVIAVVYQRGLTMQNFVPRNEQGQSPYRMGVVCPHRAQMTEEQAIELVEKIQENTNQTLEIVNYNVSGRQYSVAGHVTAIDELNNTLKKLSKSGKPAYMDIPGLDVPFHSSVLQNGVEHFRQVLIDTFGNHEDFSHLNGRYIPNLVARPFELSKSFFEDIYQLTKSPVMSEILNDLEAWLAKPIECSRKVLTELLAYQFAYPVRWIETQDLLLNNGKIEQIWEIGAGYQPTLANMFGQTLALKKTPIKPVFNVERDRNILYYLDGETELPSREISQEETADEQTVDAPKEAPIVKLPVVQTSSAEGAKPPATSLVKHSLRTILALQTKIWPSEMEDGESIDQLLGGNSSRRNQAVVDIWTEFNIAPIDGGHELPLTQLEEAIEAATAGRYTSPGSYLKVAHTEAIKRTFAKVGNVTLRDVVKFIQENWIIDDITIFQVLSSIAVTAGIDKSSRTNAPSSIDKNIKNSKEAHSFIENILSYYQGDYGWSFSGKSGESSGAQVDSAAVDKILERYFGIHGVFAELARCTQQLLGHDPYAAMVSREKEFLEEDKLELYKNEHGAKYISSIRPRFFPRKVRNFTCAWNWTRAQVMSFYWDVLNNRSCEEKYQHILRVVSANPINEVRLLIEGLKEHTKNNNEAHDIFECLHERVVSANKKDLRALELKPTAPNVTIDQHGIHFSEVTRDQQQNANDFVSNTKIKVLPKDAALITEQEAGTCYHDSLEEQASKGISFLGKVALVTGAGERAIATSVVKNLLRGGANVILTTTRPTPERVQYYKKLYRENAGFGAQLHVVPFNQGCGSDIRDISEWIYQPKGDYPAWELDYFIPFGAIPEESNLTTLDDGSVATMRVMLFGVEYLLGKIAEQAVKAANNRKKIQVILPLSPNHGQFGNDGMYAETKAGLEVLLNKWKSEHDIWGKTCSIVGAQIGWVRGTSLMSANDIVAAGLESRRNVRTYSCDEMAFLLTGLLNEKMCQAAQKTPLKVNLMGRMEEVADLGQALREIRVDLQKQVEEKKETGSTAHGDSVIPLNISQFPQVPTKERLAEINKPTVSLEDTIVIVGYGEVGTFGNAQIRWDLENIGQLSETRALELARVIGLIEFRISREYVGWVDVASGQQVGEREVATKYQEQLIDAIGIRSIDPELAHFDPLNIDVYSEVSLENEVKFRVDDRDAALSYKKANPEKVDFFFDDDLGCYWVLLHKATKIRVPKHESFDRNIAGQIPSGWSANRFGLPNDMCQHLDYNTQYSLVGTADAFVSSGVEPEELYKYTHPSKVGNTLGSGLGGGDSLAHLSRDLVLDDARQGDRIQETLVNVMGAYNVQSYVGSYGTVASPANACATAAISVEIGMEKILAKKADFIVAGSYDDLSDTGVLGFKDMNATANTDDMKERGFAPHEMSRPNDVMRSGFVEGQGGGTILLCRASLALEAGLPVYGIVAMSYSATDGIHQSIPAPGLGLLSVGAEDDKSPSALRQSLENYGLSVNDLAFVSKHDTSTEANDKNESQLYHSLMEKLGRTKGLPLMVISQKSITGHSKGGAAAWQINGMIQAMQSGIIPGNRNLLDIDIRMKKHTFLAYNDETVDVGKENIKAGLLTSLGFGHVGAMLCLVHPDIFFKMLSDEQKESYTSLRQKRWQHRYKRERNFLVGNEPLLRIRDQKPYDEETEKQMLLSPKFRK